MNKGLHCICVCVYMCVYMWMCVCVDVCFMYMCARVCVRVCVPVYIYIYQSVCKTGRDMTGEGTCPVTSLSVMTSLPVHQSRQLLSWRHTRVINPSPLYHPVWCHRRPANSTRRTDVTTGVPTLSPPQISAKNIEHMNSIENNRYFFYVILGDY